MNILVTGGSGFIGRHVVANLKRSGHEVTIYSQPHNAMVYDLVRPAFEGILYCFGDVRQPAKLRACIEQCDAVMHLAGVLGTAESVDDPTEAITTNILGSMYCFEACRRANLPGCYIAVGNHWMINPYSITKTAAEKLAVMYNREHDTRIAVVRGLNAYGPYQKHKPVRKVIPNFVLPALRGEPVIVYGSGEQIMDFIFVEDLAEILCRALLGDHGGYTTIFEAGSGRRTTINQVAETVVRLAGSRSRIEHQPMRPGEEPGSTVLADTATLKPLDYGPEKMLSLEEGLERTLRYYRDHLEHYT